MIAKPQGASMVEYVVLAVLLVALVGAALLALSGTIADNILQIYNSMNDPGWS